MDRPYHCPRDGGHPRCVAAKERVALIDEGSSLVAKVVNNSQRDRLQNPRPVKLSLKGVLCAYFLVAQDRLELRKEQL